MLFYSDEVGCAKKLVALPIPIDMFCANRGDAIKLKVGVSEEIPEVLEKSSCVDVTTAKLKLYNADIVECLAKSTKSR